MSRAHLVVDGSNIATEGRTAPSLAQLDEAVRSFIAQQGYDNVTVIVDATFGHRIDAAERAAFEAAILAGELVTPPAGTIGRGDAFILQVARQADADVLSNDSFQELHAEHPWLFEPGRLWGGKPVPAVGWVYVPRAPVRGVTSRRAVKAAKKATATTALAAAPATTAVPPKKARASKKAAKAPKAATAARAARAAKAAPVVATTASSAEAATNELTTTSRRRRRRGGGGDVRPAVNEQAAYAMFVIDHPVGSPVSGVVDRFSSHGAYVGLDGGAVGYVALKSLGDPPPRSAREVLTLGEQRSFIVARFDPVTRGIDVVPTDVDALTTSRADGVPSRRAEAVAAPTAAESIAPDAEEAPVSPAKKAAKKKAPARKKAAAKRAPARKATAKKAPARKKATAKRAPAKKKAAKKKSPAKKKATAKRAPAKKKAAKKKSPAKKRAAKKRAPAKKR